MNVISDDEFISIVKKCQTMAYAAKKLGMSYKAFCKKAKQLDCYKPNQGGKGLKKPNSFGHDKNKIMTEDILAGKYPRYQTYKLKIRLITRIFRGQMLNLWLG